MKTQVVCVALALLVAPVLAHASCDAVKASIDAKIKANGVGNYTLEVVPASQSVAEGKVVGQCEGDKQIVYSKGAAAADAAKDDKAAPAAPKPAAPKPAAASSSGG